MSTVLITGGAGFIGSHVVERWLAAGWQVVVLDDLSGGYRRNVPTAAELVVADIRDQDKLDRLFRRVRPELVYHLAANAAESKAQFSPVDITSRNYDGTIKVIAAAIRHGSRRLVFASSIAVYGQLQIPFRESDLPQPEDIYGISKLAGEQSLQVLAAVHGLEYVITRPHNVYGPRQNMQDPYRNVVTIFLNAVLQQQPLYVYGSGEQVRCFSYIDEVADALVQCGTAPVSGLTFNIGADQQYTINQLVQTLQQVVGQPLAPVYLPLRPREVMTAVSDHQLSRTHLHYQDRTELATGLAQTWDWVQQMGYQSPRYTAVELDGPLLPANWRQGAAQISDDRRQRRRRKGKDG